MGSLPMFVVYNRPLDYPEKVVVRKWDIIPGAALATDQITLFETIEAARSHLEGLGLVKLSRSPMDDPKITETWL